MPTRIITGLSEIADDYDHFILDVFGIIGDGRTLFTHSEACMQELMNAGKQICLLSNAPRRLDNFDDLLHNTMGLKRGLYHHTVTSGEVAYLDLADQKLGKNCFFAGDSKMRAVLDDHDVAYVDDVAEADFILNAVGSAGALLGDDRAGFIEHLRTAADLHLPMYCTNPDKEVRTGGVLYECAGAFAKIYEDMGGPVTYYGKPHPRVYERCHSLLGFPEKDRVCAVGDSLRTDIKGANDFGISSLFSVKGGVHMSDEETLTPEKVAEVLEGQSAVPTYVIPEFRW